MEPRKKKEKKKIGEDIPRREMRAPFPRDR